MFNSRSNILRVLRVHRVLRVLRVLRVFHVLHVLLFSCSFDLSHPVGRTGAGKSTLMLAMFRLAEADGGKIVIDGVDVSRISLKKLRRSLAIIPQDPVLWSTTIRDNLDPFNTSDDTTIWQALDSVGLKVGCVFFACWYYCPLLTSRIDQHTNRHVRITLGVEFIPSIFMFQMFLTLLAISLHFSSFLTLLTLLDIADHF